MYERTPPDSDVERQARFRRKTANARRIAEAANDIVPTIKTIIDGLQAEEPTISLSCVPILERYVEFVEREYAELKKAKGARSNRGVPAVRRSRNVWGTDPLTNARNMTRSLVIAYAEDKITLPHPLEDNEPVYYAPSFKMGEAHDRTHPYTATTVANFFGFDLNMVKLALSQLEKEG